MEGFANATAPGQGEWQSTGWFEFVDNELDFGQTFAAPGYPAPYLRTQYVSDELPDGQAASSGHLFDFTTGIAGEVSVDLYMYYYDEVLGESYVLRARENFRVTGGGTDASEPRGVLCGWPCRVLIGAMLAGTSTPAETHSADFNNDGYIDLEDFAIFMRAFGWSGGRKFEWDANNRLIAVTPSSPQAGDEKVEYDYDAFGRKVLRIAYPWDDGKGSWGDPVMTKFVYDGWRVIMELDGLNGDAVTRKHTWGLDLSGSLEGAGGIGGLLATEDTAGTPGTATDDRTFICFYDANGNVGQLVETTTGANYGSIAAHYEYAPYGERINDSTADTYEQPFRFSTKWFDDACGLGYWGYRHYDAVNGRWVNRDPIGEKGGINLYQYAMANPVSRIDFLGLSVCKSTSVSIAREVTWLFQNIVESPFSPPFDDPSVVGFLETVARLSGELSITARLGSEGCEIIEHYTSSSGTVAFDPWHLWEVGVSTETHDGIPYKSGCHECVTGTIIYTVLIADDISYSGGVDKGGFGGSVTLHADAPKVVITAKFKFTACTDGSSSVTTTVDGSSFLEPNHGYNENSFELVP